MKQHLLPVVAALATAAALPAAETPAPPAGESSGLRKFLEQDYLSGDWGGGRSWLSERGVDFEFLYGGSVPVALSGGLDEGSVYAGALLMMLDLDSEKLAGYAGGRFHASSLWLHSGDPFSQTYVGDLNKVNLFDFPDMFRLWELWYEQQFLDGRVSLKLGQLDVGMDFILPEYFNSLGMVSFLNQTFFFPTMAFNVWDQPLFPPGQHGLASTPYGSPGARLRVNLTPALYAQAGVYDGYPDRSTSGTELQLSSDEGALSYFELGYRHNQGPTATGAPGNFKLGGWYHTDDFVDMYQGTFNAFDTYVAASGLPLPPISPGPAEFQGGNYGGYLLIDHMLWREVGKDDPAQQGLVGFALGSMAPADRNLAEWGVNGGLLYKGLIPSRDWDSLSVGFSYLKISDDLREAQGDINALLGFPALPEADYEAVLEMGYRAQLAAWWSLQVSAQHVWHPGGNLVTEIPDAWVFIVQTVFRL